MTNTNWPLVDPLDHGIRPAGPQAACLYCRQKIGQPHDKECVVVTKRVELRVAVSLPGRTLKGTWQLDEVHAWDEATIENRYNYGSWCADNFLNEKELGSVMWDADSKDAWGALTDLDLKAGCLCGSFHVEFVRVVDGTPRRLLWKSLPAPTPR